jgi:hypothetical protein
MSFRKRTLVHSLNSILHLLECSLHFDCYTCLSIRLLYRVIIHLQLYAPAKEGVNRINTEGNIFEVTHKPMVAYSRKFLTAAFR